MIELRLYGDLTRWSRLQTQCVSVQGEPCAVFPDGTDATPGATTIQNIRRGWNDTYGANLGVSVWATANLKTSQAPASRPPPRPARRSIR